MEVSKISCSAMISTRSTLTKTAKYPGFTRNQTGGRGVKGKIKFGHFRLLFCRGWQRNLLKFKTHVQSDCFVALSSPSPCVIN